jgi:uncharacterized tellurite resistance protein B-like protein
MIQSIKTFLSNSIFRNSQQGPTDRELHLATAALLLEVSHADFDISETELKVIAAALQRQFNFNETETQELLSLALGEHEDHYSLHPFVQLINSHFSPHQKCQVIEDLWHVAYADQCLNKNEEHRIRKIADLIHVPHRDFIRTKLRVQDKVQNNSED